MANPGRSLTMVIYGESKVGKSTLAATAPYPRLMLDIEGGHRFLPIQKRYWDPSREEPPVADGTWDTAVVVVREYDDVMRAYEWLRSGKHQFKSLIIDSVSELQDKLMTKLAGSDQMKMQQWGEILRHMGGFLRDIRDLTMHPTQPLDAIVLTAMAKKDQQGRYHPYLQGQLAIQVPYFYDILGAVSVESFPHPDPTQPNYTVRRLYVQSTPDYEAGERVQGRLGSIVEQPDMSITRMIDMVYGPETPEPQAQQATA